MSATKQPDEAMLAAMRQADIIIDRGLDAEPLSERANSLRAGWLAWYREQDGPSLSRKQAQKAGGYGPTREIELEDSGILEAYVDGGVRRISTRSVARRGIALAILSHPLDGPPLKVRLPAKRYQPRRRERTAQELEGLRRSNAKRAEE